MILLVYYHNNWVVVPVDFTSTLPVSLVLPRQVEFPLFAKLSAGFPGANDVNWPKSIVYILDMLILNIFEPIWTYFGVFRTMEGATPFGFS